MMSLFSRLTLGAFSRSFLPSLIVLFAACSCDDGATRAVSAGTTSPPSSTQPAGANDAKGVPATAIFAGGCFWCMEGAFEKTPGVFAVISGFAGGKEPNPAYKDVSAGRTAHLEVVEVHYDRSRVSYGHLLEVFWRNINPTDDGGQFADRGNQYRTAIFVSSAEERALAEASKSSLVKSGVFEEKIVTPIVDAAPFYPAEDYHQDYYKKNAAHYERYRVGSGRDGFLTRTWKGREAIALLSDVQKKLAPASAAKAAAGYAKPSETTLKKTLSSVQFDVTQRDGTEPPFRNEYWDNKEAGIYVDVVSGEPLFSSTHKFKSGTGWPSFTQPLVPDAIIKNEDRKLGMLRVEVRSQRADSHLGHLFDDGPAPTGLRYCINSASLRFVPVKDLQKEGYGEFQALFD